jgi:hypothetical protein
VGTSIGHSRCLEIRECVMYFCVLVLLCYCTAILVDFTMVR